MEDRGRSFKSAGTMPSPGSEYKSQVESEDINKAEQVNGLSTSCLDVLVLAVLSALTFVPAIVFIVTFSGLGRGVIINNFLVEREDFSYSFIGGAGGILLLLYIFDGGRWRRAFAWLRYLVVIAALFGFGLGTLFASRIYPAAPIALFIVATAGSLLFLRLVPFRSLPLHTFCLNAGLGLAAGGLGCIGIFVWWIVRDDKLWPGKSHQLQRDFNIQMHCDCYPDFTPTHNRTCVSVNPGARFNLLDRELLDCCANQQCLAGFMLWFTPFVTALVCFVFSVLCHLVGKAAYGKTRFHPFVPAIAGVVLVAILAMWVAASVAGAGMALSNTVFMLAFATLAIVQASVVFLVGWERLINIFQSIPVINRILSSNLAEWVKALVVLTCAPLFAIYLCMSFLNQITRKIVACMRITEPMNDQDRALWVTRITHNQLEAMKRWEWTQILIRVMDWGLMSLTLTVLVSKFLVVFVSFVAEYLAGFSLVGTTFIFIGICVGLLLLPPVPGFPIYIAAGLLLVRVGRRSMGFWGSIFYATAISFAIKVVSGLILHLVFGRIARHSVALRSRASFNNTYLQAIRLILEGPGRHLDKMAILLAGPEWPTGLLIGMFKGVSVFKQLLYSTSVLLLIFPCVLSGALALRAEERVYGLMAPIAIAVAAILKMFIGTFAAYRVERVVKLNREYLISQCNDEEVAAFDKRKAAERAKAHRVGDWHSDSFPSWLKLALIVGAASVAGSCWIVQVYGEGCFRPFEISDKIHDKLDGNSLNLIRPLGWIVMGMALGGVLSIAWYKLWLVDTLWNKRAEL